MTIELDFIEVEDHTYVRTDTLFAALNFDLDFYIAEGDKVVEDYIIQLAARLREAIMKRESA